MTHTQVVQELQGLLNSSSALKNALREAIESADRPTILSVKDFCDYVDGLVALVPRSRETLVSLDLAFYYIVGQSPLLRADARFQDWMQEVAQTWGEFLDSPASLQHLDSFIEDERYRIDDYHTDASGWRSFNQFFARHVKPGRRPIARENDDDAVVFPADSTLLDTASIDAQSCVTIKGVSMSIAELLENSQYRDAFAGGRFCHVLLQAWNYHRFHAPLAGQVLEAQKIPGHVWLDVTEIDGELVAYPAPGFQVEQDRARVVMQTPRGLMAVIPVGMGHISSVTLSTEAGANLRKGDELGYFQFGGSDIVLLFDTPELEFAVDEQQERDQGQLLARIPGATQ